MLRVEVNDTFGRGEINRDRLADAVRLVLAGEGVLSGEVSVAVVDASTMHELNRRHLKHDYPTDVLSFLLDRDANHLDGEIIISADEASLNAPKFGWSSEAELLLYAVHGALHLCGYDDLNDEDARVMRARESHWLSQLGLPTGGRELVAELTAAERQP